MLFELTLLHYLLLFASGVIAGFMNVVAGGGSMITIPIMLMLGLPGAVANGTNRIAILAQNISATINFFRNHQRNLRLSLSLAACAVPGAIIGAYYGAQLNGLAFNRILAVVMLLSLIAMLVGNDNYHQPVKLDETQRRHRYLLSHFLMFFIGIFGGFIQIGVGLIMMPLLYRVMRLDLIAINSHKVFIVMCYSAVSLLIFANYVEIFWVVGLALAVGNSLGGWLGVNATIKKGEKFIKSILYLVLIAFIIKLWFNL